MECKTDLITYIQEGGVVDKQSMAGLYITGGEWSELVLPEDAISHFVSENIIECPEDDNYETTLEKIAIEHPFEYVSYIRDLVLEYELNYGKIR